MTFFLNKLPATMKNNSVNNRHTFFGSNNSSALLKILLSLMWTLVAIEAFQQFCQIVFSANDSEELPAQSKPYLPLLMAVITAYQSTLVFTREELEKNIKKLNNYFSNTHSDSVNYRVINEDDEINESTETDHSETQAILPTNQNTTSFFGKIYLGGSIALKSLSIIAKPLQTYLLSSFEVKVLLSDPLLLNWPTHALQLQIIKHTAAFIDTVYDFGTENAATIKSLIKTINPHFQAGKDHKCRCNHCCFTKVLTELFAILGATSHGVREAFAFCLFLVSSGLTVPIAVSVSAILFLAMPLQNYAFQGREFVKYVNQFVNYLIGAPAQLKEDYVEIEDAVLPLNTKQKLLLAGMNILIGLLVTVPSAISHAVLAKLTLNQGANDFWEFWFKEKPSAFYQNLIDKLSYLGIADAVTDACTESVEAHLKITKQTKLRMTRTVVWDKESNDTSKSIPKLIL